MNSSKKLLTVCFLGFIFFDSSSCKVNRIDRIDNTVGCDGIELIQPTVESVKEHTVVKTDKHLSAVTSSNKQSQYQKELSLKKEKEKEQEIIQKRIEIREKVKKELLDILQKLDSI
jgi:hypothetical protein|nr:MAG TPA: hypothetical protein [Caudoviricetes sp.]